jgi:hypothetical protein|tara:strand:+ start:2854 stop:3396 length:543 start_codon:yes stop_codon:yes gene_type:complete
MRPMPFNNLHHYFSWTTISIATFLKSTELNLGELFDEDMKIGKNQILGGAIVTHISRMENELGKEKGKPWPSINEHYGELEFLNFVRIRHCFAHAGGKLLPNRKKGITGFLSELKDGNILDHRNNLVNPYYEVDENDFLKLDTSSIGRLSNLCKELLAINGKIDIKTVHPQTDWIIQKSK